MTTPAKRPLSKKPHTWMRNKDGFEGQLGRFFGMRGFGFWAWACAIVSVAAIWILGTVGFYAANKDLAKAAYQSLQLFGLNYDAPANMKELNWQIQWARFLAPAVLIAAVIKLLADSVGQCVRRIWHVRLNSRARDIVLGFGPVGREVGRRMLRDGYAVTWIDQIVGGDEALKTARREAEADGGLLLIGDPSSAQSFEKAGADNAGRVFVALDEDLACLDAAEALRTWLEVKRMPSFLRIWGLHMQVPPPPPPPDIRIFTQSPEMGADLSHAAKHGFVSGRGVDVFQLRAEAVRHLVLQARWDRTAKLLGQDRVHLVLAGCGWQGEALLDEALLLCGRAGLKAPLVTVLDRDADTARARIKRRSPALFDPALAAEGWEPPRFVTCDLEAVDYGALAFDPDKYGMPIPVTAWAFCTGDDDLNMRAGLACQMAMHRRQLDGAPIHVRVWNGHEGQAHSLGNDALTQVNIFGSLGAALQQTRALQIDPDEVAKALHQSYMFTEQTTASVYGDPSKTGEIPREKAAEAWADMSHSKQRSNRRAQRHAACKLNDLGYDWHSGEGLNLPKFEDGIRDRFTKAEQALAELGFDPSALTSDSLETEERNFLLAMINEHDRWTLDRAIDGWRLVANPTDERDEARLLHTDMKPFKDLKPNERAYDGILLRSLLNQPLGEAPPPAYPHAPLSITLAHGQPPLASKPEAEWSTCTEIIITLPTGHLTRPEKTKLDLDQPGIQVLIDRLKAAMDQACFCRLVLAFPAPPTPNILALANKLAHMAWAKERDVSSLWTWTGAADNIARALIAPIPEYAISSGAGELVCPTS